MLYVGWIGLGWMDMMGWMVILGHRFSKSTFGANKNQEMGRMVIRLRVMFQHLMNIFQQLKEEDCEEESSTGGPFEEVDMEICDPCYCYTKCWLDTFASFFCVSLL